ncbi:MAG TPA: PAS domain S-box protein [Deltaproteobacteria bacterium]|nr:PAS domain S-box protein [Deltaproteobacteria bacterium]
MKSEKRRANFYSTLLDDHNNNKSFTSWTGPLKIVLIYAIFGTAWIVISDWLVYEFYSERQYVATPQTVKGIACIVATSVLVFWLAYRARARIELEMKAKQLESAQELTSATLASVGEAVLVIDPAKRVILECNRAAEDIFGYTKEELIGHSTEMIHLNRESFEEFGKNSEPVLDETGIYRTETRMKRKDGSVIDTENVVSIMSKRLGFMRGVVSVVRDVTESNRAKDNLKRALEQVRNALGVTIQVMVSTIEVRDPYTSGHQQRVAHLARAIAGEMTLNRDRIDGIYMMGIVHDIGKISIPAEILAKPGRLTDVEYALVKEHPQIGYDILKDVESPWPLAEVVRQHHERMDGSGYPRNLKGEEILLEARIMAVADVIESMASHRPYRPSLGIDAALDEIESGSGVLYDSDVVETVLRLFREKGYVLPTV